MAAATAARSAGRGPGRAVGVPRLSIVVPTRNEAGNIGPLLDRIERSLPDCTVEVVFVDDSDDATPSRIAQAAERSTVPVSLIARPPGERPGGLGGAVVAGVLTASGHWVCVMDADLQHPPERIADLLAQGEAQVADVVVASRLRPGGDLGDLSAGRRVLSRTLALVARAIFLDRLARITDPMTGFFLVRRAALDTQRLRPDGFKILLEILVSTPGLRVVEVPFRFDARHAERSKAGLMEVLRLGRTMARLSLRAYQRLARFVAVGASGFLVNNAVMAAMVEGFGLHYLASAAIATLVTTLWNFTLTELWVFGDRTLEGERARRLTAYGLLAAGGLAVRSPMLWLLTSVLGLHYLASNVLSIAALTGIRYALSARWIWRPTSSQAERPSIG